MLFRSRYSAGRKKKRNGWVTLLCVCDAFVWIARQQFSSSCWRARPLLPATQSARAPRQDNASCPGRGTARRCAPRCRGMKRCLAEGRERSEEHTSELQSRLHLVCRLLLEKKK